jgi:hypothetical protein
MSATQILFLLTVSPATAFSFASARVTAQEVWQQSKSLAEQQGAMHVLGAIGGVSVAASMAAAVTPLPLQSQVADVPELLQMPLTVATTLCLSGGIYLTWQHYTCKIATTDEACLLLDGVDEMACGTLAFDSDGKRAMVCVEMHVDGKLRSKVCA